MKTKSTYFHQDPETKPPHWVYVHQLNDPLLWEAICQSSDWDKTKYVQKELESLFYAHFVYNNKRTPFLKTTVRIDNSTLRTKHSAINKIWFYRPSVQFKKTVRLLVAINKLLTKQPTGQNTHTTQLKLPYAETL